MPLLSIRTNCQLNNKKELALEASKLTAQILSKPEAYVMVSIEDSQALIFAGNDQPAAYVELKSLGLPEDQTSDLSSSLCTFINERLDIDSARIYIEFSNAERHMWGWKDGTF